MALFSQRSRLVAFVVAGSLAFGAACSGERDADGLGQSYTAYLQARDTTPAKGELVLRRFYDAYLDALRSKDPKKALRFYRPDMEPEALNAVRLGLEFTKLLESLSGELLEVRDLGGRGLFKTRESAAYRFRGKQTTDRRDRTYLAVRLGKDWYLEAPDLGAARKAR